MKENMRHYGCLFCRTGAENAIASYINQAMIGVEAIVPKRTRRKTVAGKIIEDKVQLLPGYIFFRTENDDIVFRLSRISNVLKVLEYDDLSWKLIGRDKEFAEFLFDHDPFQLPHVAFIDGRLHFEDGFLYSYDDAVIRVNRRKKTAEVRLKNDGLTVWIGYNE